MTRLATLFALIAIAPACNTAERDTLTTGGGDGQPGDTSGGDGDTGGDGDVPDDPDGPPPPPPPSEEACNKMDILFVIDDSQSMSEEQDNLTRQFPEFFFVINEFMTASGDLLDYRIGVTTTGKDQTTTIDIGGTPIPNVEDGANGELQTGEGCNMTRPWLERDDPQVVNSFSCVAKVGTGGPQHEMPLWNLELALSSKRPETAARNAGFLRDDALLAIVILTDEDDCSQPVSEFDAWDFDNCTQNDQDLVPIEHYVDFLDGVKDGRGRWAAAVIAGPAPCTTDDGDEADEARRLLQFIAKTGTNGVFSSICEPGMAGALEDALETFEAACQNFPRPE